MFGSLEFNIIILSVYIVTFICAVIATFGGPSKSWREFQKWNYQRAARRHLREAETLEAASVTCDVEAHKQRALARAAQLRVMKLKEKHQEI